MFPFSSNFAKQDPLGILAARLFFHVSGMQGGVVCQMILLLLETLEKPRKLSLSGRVRTRQEMEIQKPQV